MREEIVKKHSSLKGHKISCKGGVLDHTDSGMEEKGRDGVQHVRWYKVAESLLFQSVDLDFIP